MWADGAAAASVKVRSGGPMLPRKKGCEVGPLVVAGSLDAVVILMMVVRVVWRGVGMVRLSMSLDVLEWVDQLSCSEGEKQECGVSVINSGMLMS